MYTVFHKEFANGFDACEALYEFPTKIEAYRFMERLAEETIEKAKFASPLNEVHSEWSITLDWGDDEIDEWAIDSWA